MLTGGAAAGGFQIGVQRLASADQVTQRTSLAAASGDDTLHIQVGAGTVADVSISAGDTLDHDREQDQREHELAGVRVGR